MCEQPPSLFRLATFLLLILPCIRLGDMTPQLRTTVAESEGSFLDETKTPNIPNQSIATNASIPGGSDQQAKRWKDLRRHLDLGRPISLQIGSQKRMAWLRPTQVLGENFQITLGSEKSNSLSSFSPKTWTGFVENLNTHISLTIAGNSLAAQVSEPDGNVHLITTQENSDSLVSYSQQLKNTPYTCHLNPQTRIATAKFPTSAQPSATLQSASIEAVNEEAGQNPATKEYDRNLETSPGGQLYEDSLKDAYLLLVLDKSATGSDDTDNLTDKTAQYLARVATLSAIYQHQIGTRILLQELILIPDTIDYTDIEFFSNDNNQSIKTFNNWVQLHRPLEESNHTFSTKVGAGLSGSTLGLAYTNTAKTSLSSSMIRTGYDFALMTHELGHILGTSHTLGGVMNASFIPGEHSFFAFAQTLRTAASHIYSASQNDLEGPAPLRNPDEIPFALHDFARTDPDLPVTLQPLDNDLNAVPGGEINTELSIAEIGPIFPIGVATVEQVGDTLTLTPSPDYQGIAWFSYTLRGNIGNEGQGWLHKADIAVLIGELPEAGEKTLRPGDNYLHIPDGSGEITLQTLPTQAHAALSLDDHRAILIVANKDASGSDTLTYLKNGQTHTLTLNYSSTDHLQTRPDIYTLSSGQSSIRFNPTQNDSFPGTRLANPVTPSIGTTNTSMDLLTNGYTLTSAALQDPTKGTLTLEAHTYLSNGIQIQRNTGFLTFEPRVDATGITEISYTIEDAVGNSATESILIYLQLHDITSPSEETSYISEHNGLHLEFTALATPIPELTGDFKHNWTILSKPLHASVELSDPTENSATITFSHTGTYSLELTTEDDNGNMSQTIRTIHVISEDQTPPDGFNLGPIIKLPTGTIETPTETLSANAFEAMVTDQDGPGILPNYLWEKLSGPGSVLLSSANSIQTNFEFTGAGTYLLRLSADDLETKTFRDVTMAYNPGVSGQPVALGIAPLDISINADLQSIELDALFEDEQDPDSALTYDLKTPADPELFQTLQIQTNPSRLELQPISNISGNTILTLQATDTDGNTTTLDLEVIISNHPPTLDDAHFTLPENSSNGTSVATLSAHNPDGDTILYELISSSPFEDVFALDMTTGEILVIDTNKLDFEISPEYILVVSVTDDHLQHTPRSATITIELNDVNEAPYLESETLIATSLETSQFTLKTLAPTDPENHDLSIEITSGNDAGRFSIDAEKNLLFDPFDNFDIYTSPRHTITLQTTDNGSPPLSSESTLQIDFYECLNPPETFDLRYVAPRNGNIDSTWQDITFNDSRWRIGKFPMGFDTSGNYSPYITTDVQGHMYQRTPSMYIRLSFTLEDASKIGTFFMMADYDDGLEITLNGNSTSIFSGNAPNTTTWDSPANADQSATPPTQTFDNLRDFIPFLTNSNNVLCLHLMNSHSHDTDAYLDAQFYVSSVGTILAPAFPTLEIGGAGLPGRTSARPSGSIVDDGGEKPEVVLVIGREDVGQNPELWEHQFPIQEYENDTFEKAATGLLPGATYYYGFYATNSGGTGWTSTGNSFTTWGNDSPEPKPEEYEAIAGTPFTVTSENSVLANDTDPEGDALNATLLISPQHGTLEFNADGTFIYTADANYSGTDAFTYIAADPYDYAETEHIWISKADMWKYLDTNEALHYTWRRLSFDDTSWSSGAGELGYGDDDETTTLSYGGDAQNKTPTYYFRKTFNLPDDAVILSAKLLVKRDDAVAIHLNGQEIHRDDNLALTASHNNFATAETLQENSYSEIQITSEHLQPGENLLAAEVHQANPTDEDLSFDLELSGTLQASTSVTINVLPSEEPVDSDDDGLSDFLETALGTDPASKTAHTEALPSLTLNDSTPEIVYTRAKTSYTYTLQISNDLFTWQNVTSAQTQLSDNPDGTETVTTTLNVDPTSNLFIRLEVSSE